MTCVVLLSSAAAWAHALPAPQDLFKQLASPISSVPMQPERRSAVLPALAFLPAEGDAVLAEACPGSVATWLMQAFGKPLATDFSEKLNSISSAALLVGEGGGLALQKALPFIRQAGMLKSMQGCEEGWCARARTEHVPCIQRAFGEQRQAERKRLLGALERFSLPPIYYALTAKEGHEQDFAAMHRQIVDKLRRVAQENSNVQFVEHGGYAGVRMSWLTAIECAMGSLNLDGDLRRALSHRELYLLTRNRGCNAMMIACCRLCDIVLPPTAEYSMLYSPRLEGADAHMDSLIATAWVSAPFQRAIRAAMRRDNAPLMQACARALCLIGETDPSHQLILNKAASQLIRVSSMPDLFDEPYGPLTMQCWHDSGGIMIESVGDAGGMRFAPGELRLAHQAAAQETIFYLESTAFSAPHPPNLDSFFFDLQSALSDISRGVALTLREGERGTHDVCIRYADLLKEEIVTTGRALRKVGDGLASPFAALINCVVDEGGEEPSCAWAFGAAVRDRAALSSGWKQLLSAFGQTAEKLGIPPGIVRLLPVSEQDLGNGSVAYSAILPPGHAQIFPGVALNNQYFVVGNNSDLNAHVLSAANGNMTFCGAVSSLHVSSLARALKEGGLFSSLRSNECTASFAALVERLARSVESVYSVSTIADGIRTARALVVPVPRTIPTTPTP